MTRRAKLIIAVFLALILGFLPISVAIWYGYQAAYSQAEENLIIMVSGIAHSAVFSMNQVQQGFKQMEGISTQCTPHDVDELQDLVFDLPYLTSVNLVAPNGDVVCSSWGKTPKAMKWPQQVEDNIQGFHLTGPIHVPGTHHPVLILSQRRKDGYQVNAVVNPVILSNALMGNFGSRGFTAIVRSNDAHVFVSRGRFSALRRLEAMKEAFYHDLQFFRIRTSFSDQVDRHVIAIPIQGLPNTLLVAAVSKDWLLQNWWENVWLLLALGAVISALLVFVVVLLTRQRLSLMTDMRRALKKEEFILFYQPVVDLQNHHQLVGVEVLLRWYHPEYGFLEPGDFINLAEKTDFIEIITAWIFRTAIKELKSFLENPDFHVAVNVSPHHLNSPHFMPMINAMLKETGVNPAQLIVEIVERGLLQGEGGYVKKNLNALKEKGIGIAVDDFGTGYSSLGYISQFDLTYLKIDRMFVESIGEHNMMPEVVEAVIRMAKKLNLKLIAEGIEKPRQALFLKEHHVEWGQGYLFGRPGPLEALSFYQASNDVS